MSQTPSIAAGVAGSSDAQMKSFMSKVQLALLTRILNTGGLVIKAGGSALAKTVNTVKFLINGNLGSKAAADCAALSGTVTNAKFNVFCFFVSADGTMSSAMGTEGATLADVVFPTYDQSSKAMIGFVIINPTGTGNFVGGTTPLDDGTVVPNAAYVDVPNTFNPGAFISL